MSVTTFSKSSLLNKATLKRGAISVAVFIAATVSGFYLEEPFRRLMRWLYILFTNNGIYFVGKNFHVFASPSFLVSFGLWWVVLYQFLIRLRKNVINYTIAAIIIFALLMSAITAFDSNAKLMTCTVCKDNKLAIGYNDLSYDTIFILSLIMSIIPIGIGVYKQYKVPRSKIYNK